MKKKKLALHWKIILGILFGIIAGIFFIQFAWGKEFVVNWIKPFGTIFINLLKLIAIPLIIASLIKGISDLKDISQLSKMGMRTLGIYIFTTVMAIGVGLILVNVIQPGNFISDETRTDMLGTFGGTVGEKMLEVETVKQQGPLQPLVDIVPENIFESASSNGNMLQVIFFTILCGVGLVLLPEDKSSPVKKIFDSANELVLKLVDIIMLSAPFGVFALMASLVAESPSADIFVALGMYGLTVLLGLVILVFGVYGALLKFLGKANVMEFYRKFAPAQLVAFSTSSSAATLPVTMERVEEHIGVHKEVSSFVLPIGATVNMDGTSLYQGVAAVFIAQVFGYDLTLMQQLSILMTATLASIGAAAVPGAGILMLVIVLESIGINPAGIALIFAVDRPLDMCRTAVNVTGDAIVSVIINRSTGRELTPTAEDMD
ncbi:dicarboxylate/amino acid:cation symporter [Sphingobacterium sp. SGG-5]|uniref:dicarboxylate/amino acid:cation symporter n=1 Tax=Sphingobacterium sp. SGG-5 TaxID=2710881 RepID=UPI0013EB5EF6|nr:dicarboxylate/amino acid:cation symporter [Sphingobacterium sp. SGG-5]NGM61260.1 dicarboxylate/amino acid:cation symporter [Sphingobacterium sp. SGG-5]